MREITEAIESKRLAISVIVPAFNAQSTIHPCLSALLEQTVPGLLYEVIVVDDASTDRTQTIARSFSNVTVLTQDHHGPAAARNLGAQAACGGIILFTDADCVPARDWVEKMAAPFQVPEIMGVKGAYLSRQRSLVARFVQLEYEDKYDRMTKDRYIDFIDTYSAGYRRNIFLKYGGFDDTYLTSSVEDQEFSFRLAAEGHKLIFLPEARVYHLGHASNVSKYFSKKYKIGLWKVRVHKRHPLKIWRDSHTPQVLKVQIFLVFLSLFAFLTGILYLPVLAVAALSFGAFLASAIPFLRKAWPKDRQVALVSPVLLFLRALGLGLGFGVGLVKEAFYWQDLEKGRIPR
jgi:glycosyltransferase involved in cell wall biosynthesis